MQASSSNSGPDLRSSRLLILLLVTLGAYGLPFLVETIEEEPARQAYRSLPMNSGPWDFLYHQTFEEKRDVDLLLLGASFLWANIDTAQVQEALSRKWDREATVLTFASNWRGEDMLSFLLSELLQRRRVSHLILAAPKERFVRPTAHKLQSYWMTSRLMSESHDLPWVLKGSLLASFVHGAPRKALSLFREDLLATRKFPAFYHVTDVDRNCGALFTETGYFKEPFVVYQPNPLSLSVDQMVFDDLSHESVEPVSYEWPPFAKMQLEKIAQLCQDHEVKVTILHLPLWSERHQEKVRVLGNWNTLFGSDISLIGVAPALCYRDITEDQIKKISYLDDHFNRNGAAWFTQGVLPALIESCGDGS